jgi:hypothetical protein
MIFISACLSIPTKLSAYTGSRSVICSVLRVVTLGDCILGVGDRCYKHSSHKSEDRDSCKLHCDYS